MRTRIFPVIFLWHLLSFPGVAADRWTVLNSPTSARLTNVFFIDDRTGWVAGDSGIILYTTDFGAQWARQMTGTPYEIADVFFLTRDLGWALAWKSDPPFGTIILSTTTGGAQWQQRMYPVENAFMSSIYFLDSVNGWLGSFSSEILSTTNAGMTWEPAAFSGGDTCRGCHVLNFTFYSREYAFAVGGCYEAFGCVWRTMSGGDVWWARLVGPDPIFEIHMIDSLRIITVIGDPDNGLSGAARSSDAGITWTYEPFQFWGLATSLSFRTPAEGWASLVGFTGQFLVTNDTGTTWVSEPTPMNRLIYDLVFVDSVHGYAVGDSGTMLRYKHPTVEVPAYSETRPRFMLAQSYPNPFNSSTLILYTLPVSSFTSLRVYDLLGREVATLVSGHQPSGDHSVTWDASGVPSGVYFYRLQSGDRSETKRIVLLR